MDGVGGGENSCTSIQRADDTSLRYGNSLLLHGFMEDDSSVVVHFVKLINTTDTTVGQDQSTRLKNELTCLGVLCDVNRETDCRTSLTRGVDASWSNLMNVLEKL